MINRRPGGLQQTNYSLPPLFKEKELEFPKASPSKFTPPTVGVQPNYSGGNRIDIDFPNAMRTGSAVKSSVGETLRGGSSYLYGGSQYKAGRGFVRSQNEEPIDTMGDPGSPGPLNAGPTPGSSTKSDPYQDMLDQNKAANLANRTPVIESIRRGGLKGGARELVARGLESMVGHAWSVDRGGEGSDATSSSRSPVPLPPGITRGMTRRGKEQTPPPPPRPKDPYTGPSPF